MAGDGTPERVRQVANHYSARPNQTREQREASPIIHLKKLNNWVPLSSSFWLFGKTTLGEASWLCCSSGVTSLGMPLMD
jgi:hypothetical protein